MNLDDVWRTHSYTAAHGQLFATEFVEAEDIEDEAKASPHPGEHDFWGMAPHGDNELIVTNCFSRKIDVLSV